MTQYRFASTTVVCWLSLVLPLPVSAAIYRCTADGGTTYADKPCGPNAAQITIPDNHINGHFGQGTLPASPIQRPSAVNEPATATPRPSPCKTFLSTDLRRYIISKDIVPGMTTSDVRESLGPPGRIESGREETWVYSDIYHGYIIESQRVVFRDNCVIRVEKVGPKFR